ncbi:MAG: DcaP family trimeric outer membrane transporter [Steroidobacteraceae bacterium]
MHHRKDSRPVIRRMIATTLAVAALGCSAGAYAQTDKEQALEARVAELEKLVQQLVAEKQAAPAPVAAAPAKPAGTPVQATSITPNAAPGTTFLLTGFVKADANFTSTSDGEIADNSIGRDFYVPGTIPVGGDDEDTDLNAHVKQSRVNFGTDTILEGGDKLMTRFEIDFYGSALGDQRISNTYAPVVRHAFVQWRNWLVGQTWSNFMDVATLPEAADFIGTTDGTSFVRQPQVRYTNGGFSISLENPETTITPFGGGARITTDDSTLPDLTARYAWKGTWGHLAVAGLVRELAYETTGVGAIDDSTMSAAFSLSGKFNFGQDDIRWMLLGGNLGRYVALNFANEAVLDANGELEAIDGYAGFIAYRHMWSPKLRSTLSYAMEEYDNDTDLTGTGANKSSDSWTINLFYSPIPKLDIGAEYRRANRELESGVDGDMDRLQFTTKYSF